MLNVDERSLFMARGRRFIVTSECCRRLEEGNLPNGWMDVRSIEPLEIG